MIYRVTMFTRDDDWQCTWHGTKPLALKEAAELSDTLGHALQVDEFDFKFGKDTALFLANHGWEHPMNLNGDLVKRIAATKPLKDIVGVAADMREFELDGVTAKPKKRKAHSVREKPRTPVRRRKP